MRKKESAEQLKENVESLLIEANDINIEMQERIQKFSGEMTLVKPEGDVKNLLEQIYNSASEVADLNNEIVELTNMYIAKSEEYSKYLSNDIMRCEDSLNEAIKHRDNCINDYGNIADKTELQEGTNTKLEKQDGIDAEFYKNNVMDSFTDDGLVEFSNYIVKLKEMFLLGATKTKLINDEVSLLVTFMWAFVANRSSKNFRNAFNINDFNKKDKIKKCRERMNNVKNQILRSILSITIEIIKAVKEYKELNDESIIMEDFMKTYNDMYKKCMQQSSAIGVAKFDSKNLLNGLRTLCQNLDENIEKKKKEEDFYKKYQAFLEEHKTEPFLEEKIRGFYEKHPEFAEFNNYKL